MSPEIPKISGVNWDDVAKGQTVPEGRHPARIDAIEAREGRTSGNPYLNIEFTLTEEPIAGRKVWDVFMLNPEALWKLRNLAAACDIELSGEEEFDPETLLQQEVGVIVAHEVYEERERNRVKGFFQLT